MGRHFTTNGLQKTKIGTEPKFPLTVRRRGVFFHLTLRGSGLLMAGKTSDLVQGTLDMLILKTLALEPMHGYESRCGSNR